MLHYLPAIYYFRLSMGKLLLIILVVLGCGPSFGQANQKVFPLGVTVELPSRELSEKRILNIYLPEGYRKDTAYPVIYLLDGSANEDFIHIVGVVQFLTMIQAMPPTIVVGIANVDRKRDLTFPTTVEKDKIAYPTTGGSARFISFLEKEVVTWVEKKFRCTGSRTIIGQSLGGLLATQVLLEKPGLFNNYIIVSPSLWWNNESLLASAPHLLRAFTDKPVRVCISVGAEGDQMEGDAKQLVSLLTVSGRRNLTVNFVPMPQEDHLTILHNSVYKCLELLNKK